VIWIDELEKAFAQGGGKGDSGTSTRVLGTILTWMQEKKAPCFVVATANNVAELPPELLRRGRFDEIFFLDLPDAVERRAIISLHLKKRRRDPRCYDLDRLIAASDGQVGAEIEQAIVDALYQAFSAKREPDTEDIVRAMRRLIPLAVSSRETVAVLRRWLEEGRAQSASRISDAS
jgi:SpoVK/Ycf46/Vps4 family AAA+-type ATPase